MRGCGCKIVLYLCHKYPKGKLSMTRNKSGEGNGNPLQYSCLENPVDRGAWWAAVYSITQSWTRLKRLSRHALEMEMATHSQYSCLESPRDGGAWRAAVYGVVQSWTQLKRLSSSSSITFQKKKKDPIFFKSKLHIYIFL